MRSSVRFPRLASTVVVCALALAAPSVASDAKWFNISILNPDGSVQSTFQATPPKMHVNQVKIRPNGDIWLARSDNTHTFGVPDPNDMVTVFDWNGTLLRTISGGGMQDPTSVGLDSQGNIYVPASDEFFTVDVYKYDANGSFLSKFHTSGWTFIYVYNDIETAPGDRLYVSAFWGSGSDDQMTEFDTAGHTSSTFSPTGPDYFHRDIALSPTNTIWVRSPKNGVGDDLIREFDLAGNQLTSFSTTAALPPGVSLTGLEVRSTGNLLTLDTVSHNLYELSPAGALVEQIPLAGLSSWITDFTVAPDGRILVAHEAQPCGAVGEQSYYGSGWPGTHGEPQLTSTRPSICDDFWLSLTNSSGVNTLAVMFAGLSQAQLPTVWDGTLLVLPSWIIPIALSSYGLSIFTSVPCDAILCGVEVDMQALEADPGASKGVSFTPGLKLALGN